MMRTKGSVTDQVSTERTVRVFLSGLVESITSALPLILAKHVQ